MKVILTCGGTGGHITPAVAIADTIRENCRGAAILFVGSEQGMENRIVPAAGYPIRSLRVVGLRRSLSPANLKALYLAAGSVRAAKAILRDFCPDIVIGTGGYASFPTLFAASSMGIPAAAHESNAVPGLAVRSLARRLDRIWVNFSETARELPRGHCLAVGNPLPRGFGTAAPCSLPSGCTKMVLSFGGSLGAREVNRAALALMEREAALPEVYHLHATGKNEYESWRAVFEEKGLHRYARLKLVPYISDMPRQMASATVVICRAGAMSISELAAAGKSAVLIPSPNVTGNHQYKNAEVLERAGAAMLLSEENLAQTLPEVVTALLRDAGRRREMEKNIAPFFQKESNKAIYEDILRLCTKHGK